jgi:polysaccharide pyruvyl transferase WcaK-like protein
MGHTVEGVDLVIAVGAQYMADSCRDDAIRVLNRLEAAMHAGAVTAMVGQGFGPIDDTELQARSRAVLPFVDLIFVRERLAAPPLLASFGVDSSRIVLTGDDAVEMAYRARGATGGDAMGVSMRVAHYSGVTGRDLEPVGAAIRESAAKHDALLMAISISQSHYERDDDAFDQLVDGYRRTARTRWRYDSPDDIIRRVGRCRIVVTGTFHTALFALAQGIPAVVIAKSRAYVNKFEGLADQFGEGCRVIYIDKERSPTGLASAIESAWLTAADLRPSLLAAAQQQIRAGHTAYRRLYELVESRRAATSSVSRPVASFR